MLAPASEVPAMQNSVGVLRFRAEAVPAANAAAIHSSLSASEGRRDGWSIPYTYDRGARVSPQNLARYDEICGSLKCGLLLMGRIYARGRSLFVEAKLFSCEERSFLITITEPVPNGAIKKTGALLSRKISLFLKGSLPIVFGLEISNGTYPDRVSLSWRCTTDGSNFTISRSFFEKGPYLKIGETRSTTFVDTTVDEGIKYWYTVSVRRSDVTGIPANGAGYREPPVPQGLTMNELLDGHVRDWPEPATPEEAEREKLHLELYEKYYESYFMMTFIILVGRMYVNSGELLAYRGFVMRSWDPANRTVYLSRPGMPAPVRFFSKRLFRFLRDMYQMNIGIDELLPRVIANGVLFCVRTGDREFRQPDGKIRYLPELEAVGLATEYHRDYKKWKSNTIVFATSDEELYRKIREAELKGY